MALIDNLAGYWKMDESSGNAADSSGNSNTATNVNTTPFVAAKINNGADLEKGSAQYFTCSDSASLSITGDQSLNLWFNAESFNAGTANAVVTKYNPTGNQRSYAWYIRQTGNEMHFLASPALDGTGATDVNVAYDFAAQIGTLIMVSCVYTASAGTFELFINGSSIGTSGAGTTSVADGTAPFEIGAGTDFGFESVDGIMDEIGLWSRALSSAEITQLYNAGAGLQYPFAGGGAKGGTMSLMGV